MDFLQKKYNAIKGQFANPRTKFGDEFISGLTCPSCGRAEAYAYARDPNAILCNRRNKCGAITPLRSVCPELFQNFERDFKPTREDAERPATEFLRARGLQGALKDLKPRYFERTREGCGGAVMFPVGEKGGKAVFNGRLFSPPPGEGKTHNLGSTSGLYWSHPAMKYEQGKPTYIVEGIIDALSLIEMGYQAIAVLSSGSDPKKLIDPLLDRFKWIILAFDNDPAGHKALRKWRACLEETIKARNLPKNHFSSIMLPRGDFNDFLLSGPLEKVKKEFAARESEFAATANLATATSPKEWATIHYGHFNDEGAIFLFKFGRNYHSAKLKAVKDDSGEYKVIESVRKISSFTFKRRHRLLGFRGSDDLMFEHQFKILKPKT